MPGPAETPGSLPDDIILDILTWTPVKSLSRFRCVSRRWRALIADPVFLAAHRPRHLLVTSSPSKEPGSSKSRHDLQLMDTDGSVVRAIKGVGFFSTFFCPGLEDGRICLTRDIAVARAVDLATGEVLMNSPIFGEGGELYSFGIGRAAMSGASKVVRLGSRWDSHVEQTCEVLTLGDNGVEWRRSQPPEARVSVRYCQSSVAAAAVNGVMYFLRDFDYSVMPQLDGDDEEDDYVLCFDLESEEWKKAIKGPIKASDESWTKREATGLAELNGALCMVQLKKAFGNPSTNIWLLVDPKESMWVKAYTIPLVRATGLVVPLRVISHGTKLLVCIFHAYRLVPTLQVYDACAGLCTDAMSRDDLYGGIGLCRLKMDHFVSTKI